ncbi:hypothetical protein VTK73DRAFT_5271 [Phialemonium thermophilum]|uniref:Uncharacterized protein n=1 Tax=Phialemonium thermophilum TaxID=223376 RepID=A0ABR3V2S4_9PEZI
MPGPRPPATSAVIGWCCAWAALSAGPDTGSDADQGAAVPLETTGATCLEAGSISDPAQP